MTILDLENRPGRAVIPSTHPLATIFQPSPELIERIRRMEEQQALACHALRMSRFALVD